MYTKWILFSSDNKRWEIIELKKQNPILLCLTLFEHFFFCYLNCQLYIIYLNLKCEILKRDLTYSYCIEYIWHWKIWNVLICYCIETIIILYYMILSIKEKGEIIILEILRLVQGRVGKHNWNKTLYLNFNLYFFLYFEQLRLRRYSFTFVQLLKSVAKCR